MNNSERQQQEAISYTVDLVAETLGGSPAYRRLGDRLFVIKQGSAYVLITVGRLDQERVLVKLAAQVVSGIEMTGELAQRLLRVNARLRFGAFGYQRDGQVVVLRHSILGGDALDPEGLVAALEVLALLADDFDDRLASVGGGSRMEDLLHDEAIARLRKSEARTIKGADAWDEQD